MKRPTSEHLPSATAIFKKLSPKRQAEIHARLGKEPVGWSNTALTAVRQWLLTEGIRVCNGDILNFVCTHALQQKFESLAVAVEKDAAEFAQENPSATPEQVQELGQFHFNTRAIQGDDSLTWKRAQDIRFKREAIDLARDKFEFDAASVALAQAGELKNISRSSELNDGEKIDLARKLLFGQVPCITTPIVNELTH